MMIDTDDLLNSIADSFNRMTYIKSSEIPNIDLYMDQVTTFMDERLKASTRYKKDDDKLMTKTMINNYAKNDVIPPPVRKKYTKDHVFVLIMIYYFKSILQINDIKELMDPILESFFDTDKVYGMEDIYNGIFDGMGAELAKVRADVERAYEESLDTFEDAPENEKDYLKLYSFVCKLGCDVFVKKLLIEKIIDSLKEHKEEKSEADKSKEKSKESKNDAAVDKKGKK